MKVSEIKELDDEMKGKFRWLYLLALALIVTAVLVIVVLTLLGPNDGAIMPGIGNRLSQ